MADDPIMPDYSDDQPGFAFVGGQFPQEWSVDHPVESGEQDDAEDIRPCTWGQWMAEGVAYDAARAAERDAAFVNDTMSRIPLDWDKATNASGNPVGWEGE